MPSLRMPTICRASNHTEPEVWKSDSNDEQNVQCDRQEQQREEKGEMYQQNGQNDDVDQQNKARDKPDQQGEEKGELKQQKEDNDLP